MVSWKQAVTLFVGISLTALALRLMDVASSAEPILGKEATAAPDTQSVQYIHSFVRVDGVDYNYGPWFDTDTLERRVSAAVVSPSPSNQAVNDENSLMEQLGFGASERGNTVVSVNKDPFEESLDSFEERCAESCLRSREVQKTRTKGTSCSGFVVVNDAVCFLKRLIPIHLVNHTKSVVAWRGQTVTSFVVKALWSGLPRRSSQVEVQQADAYVKQESEIFRQAIGFSVLAAAPYVAQRLVPALNTWLCNFDAVILFEDTPLSRIVAGSIVDGTLPQVLQNVSLWSLHEMERALAGGVLAVEPRCLVGKSFHFAPNPTDAAIRSRNGAWKNFALVPVMHNRFLTKRWLAMVDDDTFVIMHNLNIVISTFYEPKCDPLTCARMFGAVFHFNDTSFSRHGILFVQGGAGIVFTRAALTMVARALQRGLYEHEEGALLAGLQENTSATQRRTCMDVCVQWAGDIRLGCCAQRIKLPIEHDSGFWSESLLISLTKAQRMLQSALPVSFHQLRRAQAFSELASAVGFVRYGNESLSWTPVACCSSSNNSLHSGSEGPCASHPLTSTLRCKNLRAFGNGAAAPRGNHNSRQLHSGVFPVDWDTLRWYAQEVLQYDLEW